MLTDIFFGLVRALIIDPLTAEIEETMRRAKAPVEVIRQVETCVRQAVPALVNRVSDAPSEGVGMALDVWLERKKPEQIVLEAAPSCEPVIAAARPYFEPQQRERI